MTRPLTLEEINDLVKRWHSVLHDKDWTKQKDLLSLIAFSGNFSDILETARMLYAVKEAIQITAIHHMANCDMDSMGQCCACKVDEALRPFQEEPK